MQGSFEKKVQEKMAGLQLTPSAPVWEKIELEIRPEKRRRRGFFWIPFAVLLLTGAAYWIVSHQQNKKADDKAEVNLKRTIIHPSKKATTFAPEKKKTETAISSHVVQNSWTSKRNGKQRSNQRRSREKAIAFTGISMLTQENRSEERGVALLSQQANNKEVEKLHLDSARNVKAGVPIALKEKEMATLIDLIDSSKEGQKVNTALPVMKDSIPVQPKAATSKKGWTKGLVVQGGRSSSSSSVFSTATRDAYYMPINNSAGSTAVGNRGPNKETGGIAFAIGGELTKALTKRFAFTVGLQYAYYSTRTKVGNLVQLDTVALFTGARIPVNSYYRNTSQHNYTNGYHVLEVPVSIEYKIFTALPLHLTAGASYGRLLKSNALTYSSANNFYYYNQQNQNKNYLNVFSSLQYRFMQKPTFELSVGPVVQYNFSRLQKESGSTPSRLFFAGLKTAIKF